MSPIRIRLSQFFVVKSKPQLEDFAEDLTAYILVQPKTNEPPTALYYLYKDPKDCQLIALMTTENVDSLLADLISTPDYDYSALTILTEDQEKKLASSLAHFSAEDQKDYARKEKAVNNVVEHRVKSGILASNVGKPISMPNCFVVQANFFNDGAGDVGNVIDVVRHTIEYNKQKKPINFYFVITATPVNKTSDDPLAVASKQFETEILKLFKKHPEISFSVQQNIFSFQNNLINARSIYDGLATQDDNFNFLVNYNPELKKIYENADAIFNIATPFPALPDTIQLKPEAQIINITEHNAMSQWFSEISIPSAHHYVTGVRADTSGLMVEDFSCDLQGSVKALQAIEDKDYIHKLGLSYPVSDEEAEQFLNATLVVPVYLGEKQKKLLAPLLYIIAQSPLAGRFERIVFHINQRCYPSGFAEQFKKLQDNNGPCQAKAEFIIGHFFPDEEDLRRLYQLSSGVGLAIISSDKVLELAISCGLFPIYPPVEWKLPVYKDLCKLGKSNHAYSQLQLLLNPIIDSGRDLKFRSRIDDTKLLIYSLLIDYDLINYWARELRPELLKNSFYKILQAKILGFAIDATEQVQCSSSVQRLFFQPPLQIITNQINKLFACQATDVMLNANQTLQFSLPKLSNEKFVELLKRCDAELFYLNDKDKHQLKIKGSANIEQFFIELGFNDPMIEKLLVDLHLDRAEEEEPCKSCVLM